MEWGQAEDKPLEVLLKDRARGFELLGGSAGKHEMAKRLKSDVSLAGMIVEIEAEAERLLGEAEPELTDELFRGFAETGERKPYELVYFEQRKRLSAFALMAWLKPELEVYVDALRQTVKAICEEKTWCLPAHYNVQRGPFDNIDLFAAETGQALTEIAVLIGEGLGDELPERIAWETERRIIEPFLTAGPYHWERLDNNWSAVCAGSIGMAALYAIEDTDRLATLLARVHGAMDAFLSGYGQDGACLEGYSYWQYGFGYYVYYMDLLKAATNGKLNGFSARKVEEIAMFQQRCFSSEDMVVSFSDSPERSGVYMGLTMRLRREFPKVALPHESYREVYRADHCGRWAHALRNVIWAGAESQAMRDYAGSSTAESAGWPTETRYMADAQWFLSRYAPAEGRSYCFAAKGGHNGEPHNHNDGGQFLLHADGEAYLADLGRGLYTRSYFGAERYTYWCNGSQGHSVPIVNGAFQEAGEDKRATVTEASAGESEDVFEIELKGMYPSSAGLNSLQRRFHWSRLDAPALTISDRFSLSDTGEGSPAIVERFVTLTEPRLVEEGALLLEQKLKLRIGYDPERWKPVVTKRNDFDHFAVERFWYTLDFHPVKELCDDRELEAVFTFAYLPRGDGR